MSTAALTHHEIMALIEPFVAAGRMPDMAASDRMARILRFRPVPAVWGPGDEAQGLDTLVLDCTQAKRPVLTRTVVDAKGHAASFQVAGADLGAVLEQALSLAPSELFRGGPGWHLSRHYGFMGDIGPGDRGRALSGRLLLVRAELRAGPLKLDFTQRLPHLRSVAGEFRLEALDAGLQELPEDLLAVQGWDWARLIRRRDHWISKLRLRGNGLRRSRTAEAALERAGAHLARVLGEPPERFHQRHHLARWGVVLRRAIPSLTVVLLIVGALLLPKFTDERDAGLWLALQYVPIAALALSFMLQELPAFEIPPLPRRSRSGRWTPVSVLNPGLDAPTSPAPSPRQSAPTPR